MGTCHSDQRWCEVTGWLRRPGARVLVGLGIGGMIALVLWLDMATGPGREPAALYDVPVLLAAVAFGVIGALVAAAAATVVYHLTLWHHSVSYSIADVSQSLLFFLLGLAVAQLVVEYRRVCAMQAELEELNAQLERRVADAVSAERQAQQKLRDSERLTLLGEAAAQVVHEVKNPLAAIGAFARRVRRQIPEEHPAGSELSIVVEEVAKLEALLHDLLDFARPISPQRTPIHLPRLLEEVLTLARQPAEQQGVELIAQRAEDLPWLEGDGEKLKRALLNVVLNGLQAMPNGGELTVAVWPELDGEQPIVHITVRDVGSGISPDHLSRIFDPFFTTKRDGTGLGLPLVKKTLEAHEGSILIESKLSEGTTVKMSLPAKLDLPVGAQI